MSPNEHSGTNRQHPEPLTESGRGGREKTSGTVAGLFSGGGESEALPTAGGAERKPVAGPFSGASEAQALAANGGRKRPATVEESQETRLAATSALGSRSDRLLALAKGADSDRRVREALGEAGQIVRLSRERFGQLRHGERPRTATQNAARVEALRQVREIPWDDLPGVEGQHAERRRAAANAIRHELVRIGTGGELSRLDEADDALAFLGNEIERMGRRPLDQGCREFLTKVAAATVRVADLIAGFVERAMGSITAAAVGGAVIGVVDEVLGDTGLRRPGAAARLARATKDVTGILDALDESLPAAAAETGASTGFDLADGIRISAQLLVSRAQRAGLGAVWGEGDAYQAALQGTAEMLAELVPADRRISADEVPRVRERLRYARNAIERFRIPPDLKWVTGNADPQREASTSTGAVRFRTASERNHPPR